MEFGNKDGTISNPSGISKLLIECRLSTTPIAIAPMQTTINKTKNKTIRNPQPK
jgi:hypothetical protein